MIQNTKGVVALVENGSGLQVLAGSNGYTGGTTVNGGTLEVDGSLAAGANVYVSGGVVRGTGGVGNVVVQYGAAVSPGNLAGAGTLTANSFLLNPGATINYTVSAGAITNFLNVTNGLDVSTYLAPTAGSQATINLVNGATLSAGTYALIGYNSLAASFNSSVFALTGTTAGDTYSLFTTAGAGTGAGVIDLSVSIPPSVVSGVWGNASGGTWSTNGNWTNGTAPGLTSSQDTATFATNLSGTAAVTLDSSRTLASLGFSTTGTTGYVIAPSSTANTLTLANGSSATTISNSGGSQTIQAPIVLGSNLSVTASTGSVLTIAGSISQEPSTNESLSVSGGGELILSGTSDYSGGTAVNAGTLAVTAASALPSSGLLTISGGGRLVLGGGSGIGALFGASSSISSGEVALSAVAQASSTIATGDENMATLGDAPALCKLAGSAVGGSAAAVPEPGTIVLLLVGAAALAAWRRKKD